MPNLLKNLELEELSLVDRPANAKAMVSLFKRDNSENEEKMDNKDKKPEDMKGKLKPYMDKGMSEEEAMKAYQEDMKKAKEEEEKKMEAENQRLRKFLIENGFVIKADKIEKKAEEETIEFDGEFVAKSAIPAPVLKALEAAEIEKADVALTKRAQEELPHFDTDVAKQLLKADFDEAVMMALKAADAAFEAAMAEVGEAGQDDLTAQEQLENLVKSYMDEKQLTKNEYAKAYAAVAKTEEGKALILKTYKGE